MSCIMANQKICSNLFQSWEASKSGDPAASTCRGSRPVTPTDPTVTHTPLQPNAADDLQQCRGKPGPTAVRCFEFSYCCYSVTILDLFWMRFMKLCSSVYCQGREMFTIWPYEENKLQLVLRFLTKHVWIWFLPITWPHYSITPSGMSMSIEWIM